MSCKSFGARSLAVLALLSCAPMTLAQTPGTTVTGAAGVTRTMAQIIAAQAQADQLGKPARPPILKPAYRSTLPKVQDPAAPPRPKSLLADAKPDVTLKAQTLSLNFLGASLTDSGAFPPDSMGTIGTTQFVVAVNGRFRSFSKTTGSADGILDVDPDIFFSAIETPLGGGVAQVFTSDPKIRFDRGSNRWLIVMIDVPLDGSLNTTIPNRILLAVSDSDVISPATVWTFFFFTAPAGKFADYPTFGIDSNAVYIGANDFSTSTGNFLNTDVWVVRKSSVTGPGPIVVTSFPDLITNPSCVAPGPLTGPFTPQGVDNLDNSVPDGYFIGVDNCNFSTLVVRRVTNAGAIPSISANIAVTGVAATQFPFSVPHLGNTGGNNGKLDALDDRLFAAQIRNGQLWTAHNIAVDTTGAATTSTAVGRDAARWYQIGNLAGTPSVTQSGTVFDSAALASAHWYWIPTIAVSGQGHAAIGFSIAGAAFRADGGFAGRLSSAGAGAMDPVVNATNAPISATYNPPNDPGPPRRWGDFSYTSTDPADNMTMWTIQEYASSTNVWGVRAIKLLAPPPAAVISTTPASLAAGLASATLTVNGSSSAGSAFYEPGAGFLNHLQVAIPGVTVNSVTTVTNTSVTLNVSTVGAAAGARNVIVTNPDGQSATGNNIFSITGGAVGPVITSASQFICTIGVACNFTITTTGVPAPAITVTGALPANVVVTGGVGGGVFSGIPQPGAKGSYPLSVVANNASGSYPQTLTLIVVAQCGGFSDVTGADIFCNEAEWLKNRGVTLGCTTTTYCPNLDVTRAQMALFMKRLGDALEPSVAAVQLQPGALSLDMSPVVCQTADIAPVGFPRIALVHWSLAGQGNGALTARGRAVGSNNAGATWSRVVDSQFMRASADQPAAWINLNGNASYAIPAGETVRFSIIVDREPGSGPGNFSNSYCHIQAAAFSQTGSSSPLDTAPGGQR